MICIDGNLAHAHWLVDIERPENSSETDEAISLGLKNAFRNHAT